MKKEDEFLKLFDSINNMFPEISVKTEKRDKKILLNVSSDEFYKKSTQAVLRILEDTNKTLSCFPDNPMVEKLDNYFSQIRSILITLALSKKDMFLKEL